METINAVLRCQLKPARLLGKYLRDHTAIPEIMALLLSLAGKERVGRLKSRAVACSSKN